MLKSIQVIRVFWVITLTKMIRVQHRTRTKHTRARVAHTHANTHTQTHANTRKHAHTRTHSRITIRRNDTTNPVLLCLRSYTLHVVERVAKFCACQVCGCTCTVAWCVWARARVYLAWMDEKQDIRVYLSLLLYRLTFLAVVVVMTAVAAAVVMVGGCFSVGCCWSKPAPRC